MEEVLSFFPIETLICLALMPFEIFFIMKSATDLEIYFSIKSAMKNRRQEFIYSILADAVLLTMLIIVIKYLKDVI